MRPPLDPLLMRDVGVTRQAVRDCTWAAKRRWYLIGLGDLLSEELVEHFDVNCRGRRCAAAGK